MEGKLILNLTTGSKFGEILSDFHHSLLKILLRSIQVSLTLLIKHNLKDSLHSSQDVIVGKTSFLREKPVFQHLVVLTSSLRTFRRGFAIKFKNLSPVFVSLNKKGTNYKNSPLFFDC